MYVQDYTMKTREEAIEMVKELLALNLYPTQTTLLYENENMMALEHETITEGKKYLMTQVQLWKGEKPIEKCAMKEKLFNEKIITHISVLA